MKELTTATRERFAFRFRLALIRFKRLWLLYDSEPSEVWNALTCLVLSLSLLNPRAGQSPGGSALGQAAPLPAWAVLFLCIALSQFVMVVMGQLRWRRHIALLSMCLWVYLTVLFIAIGRPILTVYLYPIFASSCAMIYLQISHRILNRGYEKR